MNNLPKVLRYPGTYSSTEYALFGTTVQYGSYSFQLFVVLADFLFNSTVLYVSVELQRRVSAILVNLVRISMSIIDITRLN